LIVTPRAAAGLDRCRRFLAERNLDAADRASAAIADQLKLLEMSPQIGRPFRQDYGLRELVIRFGSSGYVALYRYDATRDAVTIVAFRHQRESGYDQPPSPA
jgi:plasmid stabilization system protein ParE